MPQASLVILLFIILLNIQRGKMILYLFSVTFKKCFLRLNSSLGTLVESNLKIKKGQSDLNFELNKACFNFLVCTVFKVNYEGFE